MRMIEMGQGRGRQGAERVLTSACSKRRSTSLPSPGWSRYELSISNFFSIFLFFGEVLLLPRVVTNEVVVLTTRCPGSI